MKRCTLQPRSSLAYELIGRMADGTRNDALASANECHNELTSDLRCAKTDFPTRSWFVFGAHGSFGSRVGDFEVLRDERGKGFRKTREWNWLGMKRRREKLHGRALAVFPTFPHRLAPSPFRTSVGKAFAWGYSSWPPKGGRFLHSVELGSWTRDNRVVSQW